MSFLEVDPELDPLRSDRRYAELLHKMRPAAVTPNVPILRQAQAEYPK
jgi:hypothetical protein